MQTWKFDTKVLPATADDEAPDGSRVRKLLQLDDGGLAHFELAPRQTSTAISHGSVEEIWYFLSGSGEMWRKSGAAEETVDVRQGVSLTIPRETCFQFRSLGEEPLAAIAVTIPPWPGPEEATIVEGPWTPTVGNDADRF